METANLPKLISSETIQVRWQFSSYQLDSSHSFFVNQCIISYREIIKHFRLQKVNSENSDQLYKRKFLKMEDGLNTFSSSRIQNVIQEERILVDRIKRDFHNKKKKKEERKRALITKHILLHPQTENINHLIKRNSHRPHKERFWEKRDGGRKLR